MAPTSSGGLGEPAHRQSLTKAFASHIRNMEVEKDFDLQSLYQQHTQTRRLVNKKEILRKT